MEGAGLAWLDIGAASCCWCCTVGEVSVGKEKGLSIWSIDGRVEGWPRAGAEAGDGWGWTCSAGIAGVVLARGADTGEVKSRGSRAGFVIESKMALEAIRMRFSSGEILDGGRSPGEERRVHPPAALSSIGSNEERAVPSMSAGQTAGVDESRSCGKCAPSVMGTEGEATPGVPARCGKTVEHEVSRC